MSWLLPGKKVLWRETCVYINRGKRVEREVCVKERRKLRRGEIGFTEMTCKIMKLMKNKSGKEQQKD